MKMRFLQSALVRLHCFRRREIQRDILQGNCTASFGISVSTPISDNLYDGQIARPQHCRRHLSVMGLSKWPGMWARSVSGL